MGEDDGRMGMICFDVGRDVQETGYRRLVEGGIEDKLGVDEILAMQTADERVGDLFQGSRLEVVDPDVVRAVPRGVYDGEALSVRREFCSAYHSLRWRNLFLLPAQVPQ